MIRLAKYIGKGWGSKGYYSTRTLKLADKEKAFPKGIYLHWNHPTRQELIERPERDLNTLAAESIEDAKYMNHPVYGEGLYAKVKVFESFVDKVKEKGKALSIVAYGRRKQGEAPTDNGTLRKGYIVERIIPSILNNVDFVTRAGAKGELIFESANDLPDDTYVLQESTLLIEGENMTYTKEEYDAVTQKLQESNDSLITANEEVSTLQESLNKVIVENTQLKINQALQEALQDTKYNKLLAHEIKAIKALVNVPLTEANEIDKEDLVNVVADVAKPFLEAKPIFNSGVFNMGKGSFTSSYSVDDSFTNAAEEAQKGLYN